MGFCGMDSPRVAVIIEDDRDIRDLIQVVLTQSGFEVHAVDNGADGVQAVRTYNPAVVTLDLGLPDIDGFEVARRIRLFSDSYIIMLSARAEELDTLMGLESGADDFMTKPFRPRELRARVAAMLRRPRRWRGPGRTVGQQRRRSSSYLRPCLSDGRAGVRGVGGSPGNQPAPGAYPEAGSLTHNGLLLNEATRTAQRERRRTGAHTHRV